MNEIARKKSELRALLRTRRAALTPEQRAAWALEVARHGHAALARVLAPGAFVAAYWPLETEADPRPLAQALAGSGARLALPVVDGGRMLFRAWDAGNELVPAGFGTLGPSDSAARVDPALVLAPLLGFDRAGRRLGFGQGHYDRALAELDTRSRPFVVGVAFGCQEVVELPSEPHDRILDAVVTEAGFRRF